MPARCGSTTNPGDSGCLLSLHGCKAGWLLDGRGGAPRRAPLLWWRDGRLVAVEDTPASQSWRGDLLDLSDCTILPGLMDAHVHLFMEATADSARRKRQLETTYEERRPVMAHHVEAATRAGIVGVRDGGDYGGFALRFRHETREAAPATQAFTLRAAGRAWRAAGRYGKLIGRPPLEGERLADAVRRDLAATPRIDLVKIAQSGVNSLEHFGKVTRPQFSVEALRGAVAVAHAQGRPVMVHANGPEPVRTLIEAGCDSIEHGYFATYEVLARAPDVGTVWVPTLAPMWAYSEASGVPTLQREVARRTLAHQVETLRRGARAGVTIAAGSDAGSLGVEHGAGLWAELWLLRQAGLSAGQVVQAATTVGARLLGDEDLMGGLRVGGPATFIAVPGPPEELFNTPAIALRVRVVDGVPA